MTGHGGPSVWRLASRAVVLWIGAFQLVVGGVFAAIALDQALNERRYASRGVRVEATVIDKSIDRAVRGGNPATRYLVTFRFAPPDRGLVDGVAEVSVDAWEGVEAGQPFRVTYLPDTPGTARPTGDIGDASATHVVFAVVGGIFMLIGGALTWTQGRDLLRTARVARDGIITDGTVIGVGPTSTTINRVPQWRIQYRYRDHLGQDRDGVSHLMPPAEGEDWRLDDVGIVRFDHDRPGISAWVGKP